ncbi:MAG TPA: TetR family transcriptional regulator, partial [Deinococcales bacterium]|nr:TetR family transcriptional regulator [Deinococcales bacterium]
MSPRNRLLELATSILSRGEVLTLDRLAAEAGLSKAGVIHHFRTKEGLMRAVLGSVLDRWEEELEQRAAARPGPHARLRAYIDHSFTEQFDASNLAFLADVHLRDELRQAWLQRLSSWLGDATDAGQTAARLLADGVWFNQALGTARFSADLRQELQSIAESLL